MLFPEQLSYTFVALGNSEYFELPGQNDAVFFLYFDS